MSLSDSQILELNELCNAVVDETLTEKQQAELSHWLSTSEEARQFYIRVLGLSADLCHYAGEMQTEEPDTNATSPIKKSRSWWRIAGLFALAASVMLVVWMGWSRHKHTSSPLAVNEVEYVARLTGSKQCQWPSAASTIQPGQRLRKGQRIELANGFAEITFDSGAQVVLQGPASLNINSAWSATLNHGTLNASLPPEAMGFSISNPTVEVVDLGTEFTMFADNGGSATEVVVLKGEVEATPPDQQSIVLREKESRLFAASGKVSDVHDSQQKLAQLTQPVQLDHFAPPVGYAHWSFDETAGTIFAPEISGLPFKPEDSQIEIVTESSDAGVHTRGRLNNALRFDGNMYASAALPGISDNAPHTVAFWAKVPIDANLSNAYAMVAWGVNNEKLGSHPFHIGWNKKPSEGIVGALRTDYGGGFAIGATPLRDGRWHHIAVVIIPRDNPQSPVDVKEYVDGRFEGEGHPSPPGSDVFKYNPDGIAPNPDGIIWLGCRLGSNGVRMDRFYGELDELFIADRALEPQEIVNLMNDNKP